MARFKNNSWIEGKSGKIKVKKREREIVPITYKSKHYIGLKSS